MRGGHTHSSYRHGKSYRIVLGAAVALTCWALTPGSAGADAAQPGSTESVIDALVPETPGVTLTAVGGDAFLELTSDGSAEVVVLGYDSEPYLRIRTDGTVEENRLSPAVGLNADRGGGEIDASSDSDADPDWVVIGYDHRVAWHDHRAHWMMDSDPVAAADGVVQEYTIPLEVDGQEVVAEGRLLLVEDPAPWAPVAAVAIAVGTWFLVGATGAVPTLLVSSLVAAVLSWSTFGANPPEAGALPWPLLLALVALALTLVTWWRGRGSAPGVPSDPFTLAAVAALIGWWVFRIPWFTAAVIPSLAPGWVERLGTALVCGATLGLVARIVAASQRRSVSLS